MLTKHILCYKKFFKYKNISKTLKKIRLKNTTIYKTLTNASETWTLTKRDRKHLNIFERKVYGRILGPVYDNENENWRILTNKGDCSSTVVKVLCYKSEGRWFDSSWCH